MQAITQHQGERVLDVIDQCKTVTYAHAALLIEQADQGSTARRGKKARKGADGQAVANKVQRAYKATLTGLAAARNAAKQAGVSDQVLLGVLYDNLPGDVLNELFPPEAA